MHCLSFNYFFLQKYLRMWYGYDGLVMLYTITSSIWYQKLIEYTSRTASLHHRLSQITPSHCPVIWPHPFSLFCSLYDFSLFSYSKNKLLTIRLSVPGEACYFSSRKIASACQSPGTRLPHTVYRDCTLLAVPSLWKFKLPFITLWSSSSLFSRHLWSPQTVSWTAKNHSF